MPHPTAGRSLLSFLLVLAAGMAAPGCMVEDDGLVDDDPAEAADRELPLDDDQAIEPAEQVTPAGRRADAPSPTTADLRRGHSPYSPDVETPDDPQSDDDGDAEPDVRGPGPGAPPDALARR